MGAMAGLRQSIWRWCEEIFLDDNQILDYDEGASRRPSTSLQSGGCRAIHS
ncbi:MAG: hypothetical protein R2795_27140 [Saprospiraceae bacterium]